MMRCYSVQLIAALAIACCGLVGSAMALPIPTPDFAWLYDVQSAGTTPPKYGPYNGLLVNTPTLSTDVPPISTYGQNRSFSFLGTDEDYVRVNDAIDLRPGTGAWSLSLWFKTSGSQFSPLAAKQDSSVANYWALFPGNVVSGVPSLKLSGATRQDGGDDYETQTTADIIDGGWHHVVMTRPATVGDDTFQIWVDGSLAAVNVLVNAGTNPPDQRDISNTQPWVFGRNRIDNAPFIHFTGLMDEVAMWNDALTPADILWLSQNSLYEAPVPEPSTFALVGLGVVGLAVRRRRNRRSQ